ncbi:retinol-binding protein pinta-like [Photinus pyralis]|uniref:retinol-binding protein pinta-like n=1 Tax=Photinus pyralis TaxID=7054 RepID=UPI0012670729|nr:retinol-binding protein pinta-like [Photinus pyralis]
MKVETTLPTTKVRSLSQELQQIAEKELNEVNSRLTSDIQQIRDWINKQPHFNFDIGDQLLVSFLRCSKFSLERTKERLDRYFTIRTMAPEVFTNRDPLLPELQAILEAGFILPLPNVAKENNHRIIVLRYSNNLDPNLMTMVNIAKLSYMILDILLREDDNAVVSGVVFWSYCKDCPSKYAIQLTPASLQRYSVIEEKGFPFRMKGAYYSHVPQIFEACYNIFKVFCSDKLKQRMGLYSESNIEELFKKIPKDLLPQEFGGCNGSVKDLTVFWKDKVESCRDWFLKDEHCKIDERLRPGTPKTCSEVFGLEGSFRKLDLD